MPQFEFKRSGAMRTVAVDGQELDFAGSTAVKNLSAGEFAVHWFARGDNGQDFGLTVGKPNEKPIKQKKGTLDASRKDAGTFWLEVS